jgi:hypothetical protein
MNDALEFFEERAAILEYEAGRSRAEAEILAFALTRAYCARLGMELPEHPRLRALSHIEAKWDDRIGGVVTRDGREIPPRFRR